MRIEARRSNPVIGILEPDDIVLAEIGAGLHFDQLEIDLARIGHAMDATDRQVDRLVLMHEMRFVVAHDFRRALHDDPVLGAVEVLLQRQLRARLHDDALDLVTRAIVDALVITPGPVRTLVLLGFAPLLALQLIDELLDAVAVLTVKHEDGVLGGDYDDVIDANDSREMLVRAYMHVLSAHDDAVAADGIVVVIALRQFPYRLP